MKISIVIPSYNSPLMLGRTLSTISRQTYKPHEIIVVDDGSDPPIGNLPGVRVIRIERESSYRGSSAAKNTGATAATGDWLMFSDDDILHMEDAIESIVAFAKSADTTKLLVNIFSFALPKNMSEQYSAEQLLDVNVGDMQESRSTRTVSSEQHCGFISKSYFDALGGYDEDTFKSWGLNNQDLCIRVISSGGDIRSDVLRVKDKSLLHCFHQWNPSVLNEETNRSTFVRNLEFKSKHGQFYSADMLLKAELNRATG